MSDPLLLDEALAAQAASDTRPAHVARQMAQREREHIPDALGAPPVLTDVRMGRVTEVHDAVHYRARFDCGLAEGPVSAYYWPTTPSVGDRWPVRFAAGQHLEPWTRTDQGAAYWLYYPTTGTAFARVLFPPTGTAWPAAEVLTAQPAPYDDRVTNYYGFGTAGRAWPIQVLGFHQHGTVLVVGGVDPQAEVSAVWTVPDHGAGTVTGPTLPFPSGPALGLARGWIGASDPYGGSALVAYRIYGAGVNDLPPPPPIDPAWQIDYLVQWGVALDGATPTWFPTRTATVTHYPDSTRQYYQLQSCDRTLKTWQLRDGSQLSVWVYARGVGSPPSPPTDVAYYLDWSLNAGSPTTLALTPPDVVAWSNVGDGQALGLTYGGWVGCDADGLLRVFVSTAPAGDVFTNTPTIYRRLYRYAANAVSPVDGWTAMPVAQIHAGSPDGLALWASTVFNPDNFFPTPLADGASYSVDGGDTWHTHTAGLPPDFESNGLAEAFRWSLRNEPVSYSPAPQGGSKLIAV